MGSPADPAPQLVQLGDAEAVGIMDHHDRGVGHIHPNFDDRRGDQYVGLTGSEAAHDRVLLLARQLAVHHLDPHAGQRPTAQLLKQILDRNGRRCFAVSIATRFSSSVPGELLEEIRAQTTYAWRPRPTSSTMRCQPRWTQDGW